MEVGSLMRENYPTVGLWLKKMLLSILLARQLAFPKTRVRGNVDIFYP
jgi:hypothetical protein